MSNEGKERIESICDALKKATPEQKQYIVGFAEGMAYANEFASESKEDVPETEK